MRNALIAFCLVVAAETAAIACSCVPVPQDPVERRRMALGAAERAEALVEVEIVSPYDARSGRGERLRVRRTLAGRAPSVVTAERHHAPSGASCDVQFAPGQRMVVILYWPDGRAAPGTYRLSSTCTTYMLADRPFRAAVVEAMRVSARLRG